MVKKVKKPVSNEDLARMIARGFENTATKSDIGSVRSDIDLLSDRVDKVEERLRTVEVKLDRALYTEITRFEARIRKLEEKVGIK